MSLRALLCLFLSGRFTQVFTVDGTNYEGKQEAVWPFFLRLDLRLTKDLSAQLQFYTNNVHLGLISRIDQIRIKRIDLLSRSKKKVCCTNFMIRIYYHVLKSDIVMLRVYKSGRVVFKIES